MLMNLFLKTRVLLIHHWRLTHPFYPTNYIYTQKDNMPACMSEARS